MSDSTMLQQAALVNSARLHLLRLAPFWGTLLMHLQVGFDPTCETAYTDGKHLGIDPAFIQAMDNKEEEVEFILLHEVLHCALRHLTRRNGREPLLWNIAADIQVNSIALETFGRTEMQIAGSGVMHTIDNLEGRTLSTEEIYDRLLSDSSQPSDGSEGNGKGAGNGSQHGNSHANQSSHIKQRSGSSTTGNNPDDLFQSGSSGAPSTLDNHDQWIAAAMDDPDLDTEWTALVCRTAGDHPGDALRKLLMLDYTPKVDWRSLLRDFLSYTIYDYTWQRPDRRYPGPIVMPSVQPSWQEMQDILFCIDTSGSVSDAELSELYAEVGGMIRDLGGKGWLSFFDAKCTDPAPFESDEDLAEIKPLGGGGTSFQCIFDMLREQEALQPAAVVILTDGYAEYPTEEDADGLPLFWILTEYARNADPDYGVCVRL